MCSLGSCGGNGGGGGVGALFAEPRDAPLERDELEQLLQSSESELEEECDTEQLEHECPEATLAASSLSSFRRGF